MVPRAADAIQNAHGGLVGERDAGVGGRAKGTFAVVVAGCFEGAGSTVEVNAGNGSVGTARMDDGPFFFCGCGRVQLRVWGGDDVCGVSRCSDARADGIV